MAKKKKILAGMREVPEWVERLHISLDPAVAHAEFQAIKKRTGSLTNKAIVAAARSPSSPLHSAFEWDDSKAGERYREYQAAQLKSALVFRRVVDGDDRERITRAWVPISRRDDGNEEIKVSTWMTMEEAMLDPQARQELVDRALAEVNAWRQRYADMKELASIFAAIDRTAA